MRVIKQSLRDLGLTVLDEAAIQAYKGVEDRLRTGIYRRPGPDRSGQGGQGGLAADPVHGQRHPQSQRLQPAQFCGARTEPGNHGPQSGPSAGRGAGRIPSGGGGAQSRDSDWNQALGQAARQAADRAMQGAGPKIAANLKPGGPRSYEMRFERFRDEHLDAILADLDTLSLIDSISLTPPIPHPSPTCGSQAPRRPSSCSTRSNGSCAATVTAHSALRWRATASSSRTAPSSRKLPPRSKSPAAQAHGPPIGPW